MPSRSTQKKGALVLLALAAILLAVAISWSHLPWNKSASSYDACVKQGNPILDSYPSICVGKDGKHFTDPNEHVNAPQ